MLVSVSRTPKPDFCCMICRFDWRVKRPASYPFGSIIKRGYFGTVLGLSSLTRLFDTKITCKQPCRRPGEPPTAALVNRTGPNLPVPPANCCRSAEIELFLREFRSHAKNQYRSGVLTRHSHVRAVGARARLVASAVAAGRGGVLLVVYTPRFGLVVKNLRRV